MQALEKAVKLDPNNAQALNNLGIINYETGASSRRPSTFIAARWKSRPDMAEAHE